MEGAGGAETGRETPATVTAGTGVPALPPTGQKSPTAASTATNRRQEQKPYTAPILSSQEQNSPAAAAFT